MHALARATILGGGCLWLAVAAYAADTEIVTYYTPGGDAKHVTGETLGVGDQIYRDTATAPGTPIGTAVIQGPVGIGTTTPVARLSVKGTGNGVPIVRINDSQGRGAMSIVEDPLSSDVAIGAIPLSTGATLHVASVWNHDTLLLQAANGQTANLLDFMDNAQNVLGSVGMRWDGTDNNGGLRIGRDYRANSLGALAALHVAHTDTVATGVLNVAILDHDLKPSNPTAGVNLGAGLGFMLRSSNTSHRPAGQIAAVWTDPNDATRTSALTFSTLQNAALAPQERMRITGSGNVGIGTVAPGSRLVVQGAGATAATSALNATNSTGASMLFVRDDGNVGIGTANPNTAAPNKATAGNLDVNDVYFRSTGRWASQATSAPGCPLEGIKNKKKGLLFGEGMGFNDEGAGNDFYICCRSFKMIYFGYGGRSYSGLKCDEFGDTDDKAIGVPLEG